MSTAPPAPPPAESVTPWQRLSARMLVVHPIRELIRFLPGIIGLIIAGGVSDGGAPWWLGLLSVGFPIGLGIVTWLTTRFQITPDQVQLRRGLLSTTTVTARTDRVRTVEVTSSALHRILGLSTVAIGTGADDSSLKLDGLPAADAAALRGDLLHRRAQLRQAAAGSEVAHQQAQPTGSADLRADGSEQPPLSTYPPDDERVLLRLRSSWIRFAPFGPSGLIAAAAAIGFGFQVLGESGVDLGESQLGRTSEQALQRFGLWLLLLLLTAGALVLIVLLSMFAYVLQFWRFTLSRNIGGGTLHVHRGLFTTRATTLEEQRIRGVQLQQPLALRCARGARLKAITTGLARKDADTSASALLVPPAPVAVNLGVADAVLQQEGLLQTPLLHHGPAATRRRWTRALGCTLALAAPAAVFIALTAPSAWLALPVLVIPSVVAALLALDRARALGHRLTPTHLITRSGSLLRHTEAIDRRGVVAVAHRQSFFQRRAGVATLTVATAAGSEAYHVTDLSAETAPELVDLLLPGHLAALPAPAPQP